MLTYYLAARPETIRSIVQFGRLPEDLPGNVEPKNMVCFNTFHASVLSSKTILHQTFILKVTLANVFNLQKDQPAPESITFSAIDVSWIDKIFVYSQRGKNLISKIFKDIYPTTVEIAPELYGKINDSNITMADDDFPWELITEQWDDIMASTSKKMAADHSKEEALPPAKKIKTDDLQEITVPDTVVDEAFKTQPNNTLTVPNKKINHLSPLQEKINSSIRSRQPFAILERLGTQEEHIETLQLAFLRAQKTILVTSLDITDETLSKTQLYDLIPQAHQRKVKIYFYYLDNHEPQESVKNFLDQHSVFYAPSYTHSKILAVDDHWIALGSFNWLSCIPAKGIVPSDNGSIVCRSNICREFKETLWKYLKYYRNLQFNNHEKIKKFLQDETNDSVMSWQIEHHSRIEYLPTLNQHLGFLHDIFKIASHRIVVCSPFISSRGSYKADIACELLQESINRGVQIIFVCSRDDCYLPDFCHFLEPVLSHILLLPEENFHFKTIIIDDQCIAEGSFNWLSASRYEDSDFHNHETTMVIHGDLAKPLIKKFDESRIGQNIMANQALFFHASDHLSEEKRSQTKQSLKLSPPLVANQSLFKAHSEGEAHQNKARSSLSRPSCARQLKF